MKAMLLFVCLVLLMGCRTNETPEKQVNDLQITGQVKSQLAKDLGLSTITNISVNSTNGVVTLSGQVNSPTAKEQAEASAKSVPKVLRVVNGLQVATTTAAGKS